MSKALCGSVRSVILSLVLVVRIAYNLHSLIEIPLQY